MRLAVVLAVLFGLTDLARAESPAYDASIRVDAGPAAMDAALEPPDAGAADAPAIVAMDAPVGEMDATATPDAGEPDAAGEPAPPPPPRMGCSASAAPTPPAVTATVVALALFARRRRTA